MNGCLSILILLLLGVLSSPLSALCQSGPFGFYYGETKAQILATVGTAAEVRPHNGEARPSYILKVSTAPKPYVGIEDYLLFISPKDGLLKIVAYGKDIATNDSGDQLQSAFHQVETALEKSYGQPTSNFDFLKSGSIWSAENDWMMGLVKEDRSLDAYWLLKEGTALPNHLSSVSINAVALSSSKGFLKINYEFIGWDAFVDEVRAKQDSVL